MRGIFCQFMLNRLLVSIIWLTVQLTPGWGQKPATPTVAARPNPDSHSLYHLFFGQHSRQSLQIDSLRGAHAAQAAAAEALVAAQYGIQVSELPALSAALVKTSQTLEALDSQATGLLKSAAVSNKKADQGALDALNAKRYLTVVSGIESMRKVLSATSWVNMRSYINGQFRNSTQVIR